jgi:hypothetical protein
VISAYLEGKQNQLGEFGYNRDGKPGKLRIMVGLLTDELGEPLAVRVFKGNTGDPDAVAARSEILKRRFGATEVGTEGTEGTVSIFAELSAQRFVARASRPCTRPGRPCHNFCNY